MEMSIELLMHLLLAEMEHIRRIPDLKYESETLEFIWSNLETKLIDLGIINDMICDDMICNN